MASVQISNPALPFWNAIPGGLSVGKIILFRGIFPALLDKYEYSQINLCEHSPDIIAFHMSIRFNHRKVVRNSKEFNKWQTEEEDGPFPFALGRKFVIQILVQQNGYQVSVNGQYCWTFGHRLSYTNVAYLNIGGPLIIWNVEYKGKPQVPVHVPSVPAFVSSRMANHPRIPYWGDLPEKFAVGSTLQIKGFFPPSINMSQFTQINLCQNSGNIIAFHTSIRFKERIVVRNSYRQSQWENEEREGLFPFVLGQEFLIEIVVNESAYQISVNGNYCWTFCHRLPFGIINRVNIEGPVNIWHVDYKRGVEQKQMPPQVKMTHTPPQVMMTHTPPPSDPTPLQAVYNPPIPFSYHIIGGIKNGMMIYMSGIPSIKFQKFTVSFQCGQQRNYPDIAFSFEVYGSSSIVVRNTRRNDRWEDEETAAPHFPFQRSCAFDMIIMILNDKYMVAVNGRHFIEYIHRMFRFGQINTLKIEGDVKITSVRFAN